MLSGAGYVGKPPLCEIGAALLIGALIVDATQSVARDAEFGLEQVSERSELLVTRGFRRGLAQLHDEWIQNGARIGWSTPTLAIARRPGTW
ncbi:MAG: hypothetical protein ACR2LX_07970 [Jatrophihabitans sp.]